MGVWQRGHFMRWPPGHETDPTREYNVGALRAWERPRDPDYVKKPLHRRSHRTRHMLAAYFSIADFTIPFAAGISLEDAVRRG